MSLRILPLLAILAGVQFQLSAQTVPCPRFNPGSKIIEPKNLYSINGKLELQLSYRSRVDSSGNTLYCFVTANGEQSPTLHVRPGDRLVVHLKNELSENGSPSMAMPQMDIDGKSSKSCGAMMMTSSSVNIHYHGTNILPACHQDEVIKTTVNAGESFDYDLHFPRDEPPGLYWYHPHIHGISEPAVLGGASGALIVDGIENVNRETAGLPQQVLIVRDNLVPGAPDPGGEVPSWDVSVNYVPVAYPNFTPAQLQMRPKERQLWRLLNASADTILDAELNYDGIAQPLRLIGLDGVPTGSQDGTDRGKTIIRHHLLIPPGGRAEFIVTGPSPFVKSAILMTRNVDTGPDGDNDPLRPLVAVETRSDTVQTQSMQSTLPLFSAAVSPGRFAGLAQCQSTARRRLYFSEVISNPNDPDSPTNFFITVAGQKPALFDPNNPPAIVTRQGAVEDWIIENRTGENHEFHMHQIHFLMLEQNGVRVGDPQFFDTVQLPYWSGKGPYPSVKLRMDFRGPTVGDFVYHCHILGHEDGGMMAIIRVKPARGH